VKKVECYNLTEAKAKLSFIINRIIFAHEKITIRKKGKNVAVMMPYDDYVRKWAKDESSRGLLSAKGALADMDGFDQFLVDIYQARKNSTDRKAIKF
jgi:prevent-host-death family protein